MVRVLAIGPKIRGFIPGRDDLFLRAINGYLTAVPLGPVKAAIDADIAHKAMPPAQPPNANNSLRHIEFYCLL
jgi:hypothetical protein